jgi:MinD superfamily P-loop ATPase
MIISVASGKGGTGKTTIATNLAAVIKNSTYVDCDVEEPNGAIILKPDFDYTKSIYKKTTKIDTFICYILRKMQNCLRI